MKAASGDRPIREEITAKCFLSSLSSRVILINRAWPTTQALSFWSLPVLKCSVVLYKIECIEGRETQIESDECCYIKALIQNIIL